MTKILGISGSPRRNGNTETLLDYALEGASQAGAVVDKVVVSELCLRPCCECAGCDKTAVCVIKDDMRLIYKKIDISDALIISSPIYFGSITSQLKTMIDRFQPYWIKKYMLKKAVSKKTGRKGIFLCVSGSDRKTSFMNARSIVNIFFTTLDIKYFGSIFCGGLEEAGGAKKDARVLKRSFNMGAKLAKKVMA